MDLLVKIIAVLFFLIAALFIAKPTYIHRLAGFFAKGNHLYGAGVIRLVFAVLFLLAARECRRTAVILALGLLFLLSAVLIFLLGPSRLRPMLFWMQRQPSWILRSLMLIPIAIAILALASA